MANLQIKCPMCSGTIWVDQATGKVIDHKAASEHKADFEAFMKSRERKTDFWDKKLDKAKDDTAKRKEEMEQRFKQAKDHPEELGEVDSPFKWD
jgi:hypothetical protein